MAFSLRDRILRASRVKETRILSESETITDREFTATDIPIMNLALSARVEGGLQSGSLVIAGPSRHFKSKYQLRLMSCYLKARPNAVGLHFDGEFGSPRSYFESEGIDPERVVHIPVTSVEQCKNELYFQLEGDGKNNPGINRGDEVFIAIDSLGSLASLKEIEDTIEGKNVADMTRAKALKALFRVIRPHLILKNIPLVAVNHTYKEIGMYPKDVMSGGTGAMYNADDVWFVGRSQEKDGIELLGYHFTIKIEKSRLVREGSKFPVYVSFEKGIDQWSGLLDLAQESGLVKRSGSWYTFPDGQKYQSKGLDDDGHNVWPELLKGEFANYLNHRFALTPEEQSKIQERTVKELVEEA